MAVQDKITQGSEFNSPLDQMHVLTSYNPLEAIGDASNDTHDEVTNTGEDA